MTENEYKFLKSLALKLHTYIYRHGKEMIEVIYDICYLSDFLLLRRNKIHMILVSIFEAAAKNN